MLTLPTLYQIEKTEKIEDFDELPQLRTTVEKESEEEKNCLSKQSV